MIFIHVATVYQILIFTEHFELKQKLALENDTPLLINSSCISKDTNKNLVF